MHIGIVVQMYSQNPKSFLSIEVGKQLYCSFLHVALVYLQLDNVYSQL